jgi:hypothetical protein
MNTFCVSFAARGIGRTFPVRSALCAEVKEHTDQGQMPAEQNFNADINYMP